MLGKKKKDNEAPTAPSARSSTGASTKTSVISKDMRIQGDCVVEGRIRIEGTISGDVRATGLELAESGTVEGDLTATEGKNAQPFVIEGRVDGSVRATRVDIGSSGAVLQGVEADEAHVRGRVAGGVLARRRLVLEETAVVEGDVRARTLALKEGGQVNGTIVMGDRAKLEQSEEAGSARPRADEGGDVSKKKADAPGDASSATEKKEPAQKEEEAA